MRVLLDHNIPTQIIDLLPGHEVVSAKSMGWDRLKNRDLLQAAERDDFPVMVTADQSIFYQQDNQRRRVALVVVSTNYRTALEQNAESILAAIGRAYPGSFELVAIRAERRRGRR